MKLKEGMQEEYDKYVAINNDPYGGRVVSYSKEWADLMEADPHFMTMSDEAFGQLADRTSHQADTDGITGYMYGAAVSGLAHFWEHGDRLRRWHNKEYGVTEEQAKGGTVNPAIITITDDGSSP